jgi:hyperosmotically inducible protein
MNTIPPCKPSLGGMLTVGSLTVAMGFGIAFAADSNDSSAPQAHSNDLGAAISDTVITGHVKVKLLDEESLSKSNIMVTTTNGVVTLKGTAFNQDAINVAVADAGAVDGVKSVDNNLTTPSSSKTLAKTKRLVADSWTTTKVKAVLLADNVGNGMGVSVKTIRGVVVLKGALPNQNAVDHVKDLAEQIDSVKSVDAKALVVARK